MASSSTRTRPVKRSRVRRVGESAFGALLVVRLVVMGLLALLLLAGGVWTSWNTAQYAMLAKVHERGTMTVVACGEERCTGPYVPTAGDGKRRAKVSLVESVAPAKGGKVEVTVKPGTTQAVRTGPAGILHACVPFAGALLLAALVVAGGMRFRRTAWVMGLLGAALLGAAFTATL
ncbi:hypothetical protein FCH28_34680 [Streptomyces piniterrae]|uniref:DUF3592 domain-containing protein n=1 Tax=Streptomyces piniterrae TaxID=2571125 RepID=A0A4U0MQ48_9ACTN|nr:hypothetical protein [Streptomyces piniterrae]TJZ42542.1 hypothetical protein FCH28_34680 [Streptomyces piniterrae]